MNDKTDKLILELQFLWNRISHAKIPIISEAFYKEDENFAVDYISMWSFQADAQMFQAVISSAGLNESQIALLQRLLM